MKISQVKKKVEDIPRRIAFSIETNIRNTSKGAKHGREYKRGKKIHIASAPGEPPAKDTGNLVNNANLYIQKDNYDYYVVLTSEYAIDLEFGTKKTAPRPFIKPSIEKTLKNFKL